MEEIERFYDQLDAERNKLDTSDPQKIKDAGGQVA